MFAGRKLLIVTKHGKEEVIAPLAEQDLSVQCVVATEFDTDGLGTFTGEVARQDDALETLRRKCHEGMDLYGLDLAIASEGSFGPHPAIFVASANDELVMLADRANKLEIVARELTMDTNFCGATVTGTNQLQEFLRRAKFPGHGVIIRKSENDFENIVKGICNPAKLERLSTLYLERYGSFFIETDMRAMHNPTRMQAIRRATIKLLEKTASCCPVCATPGFGVTEVKGGLPCRACRFPTGSTLSHIYTCTKCGHQLEKMYPHGKTHEDPMYCNICNP